MGGEAEWGIVVVAPKVRVNIPSLQQKFCNFGLPRFRGPVDWTRLSEDVGVNVSDNYMEAIGKASFTNAMEWMNAESVPVTGSYPLPLPSL